MVDICSNCNILVYETNTQLYSTKQKCRGSIYRGTENIKLRSIQKKNLTISNELTNLIDVMIPVPQSIYVLCRALLRDKDVRGIEKASNEGKIEYNTSTKYLVLYNT